MITVAIGTREILLHQVPVVVGIRPLVPNLAPEVVGEMLVSTEMIGGESANLVTVEHLKAKTETVRTEERRRCVFKTLGDVKEDPRTAGRFERETEQLNERPEQRLLRNVERSVCQRGLFPLEILPNSLTKNLWLSLSS